MDKPDTAGNNIEALIQSLADLLGDHDFDGARQALFVHIDRPPLPNNRQPYAEPAMEIINTLARTPEQSLPAVYNRLALVLLAQAVPSDAEELRRDIWDKALRILDSAKRIPQTDESVLEHFELIARAASAIAVTATGYDDEIAKQATALWVESLKAIQAVDPASVQRIVDYTTKSLSARHDLKRAARTAFSTAFEFAPSRDFAM